MADLLGTTVAANYKKAAPATDLGTPTLAFAKVVPSEDISASYTASNSLFAQAVEVIGGYLELYAVGTPTAAGFVIAYNDNSANKYDAANTGQGGSTTADFDDLEDAIDGITGLSSTAITVMTLTGAGLA